MSLNTKVETQNFVSSTKTACLLLHTILLKHQVLMGELSMNEQSSKYVPKFKLDVKILTGNTQINNDYTLFLGIKKKSGIPETVIEYLEFENRLFLPVIHKNNNTFELMNIYNIIYIKETQKSSAKAGKTITLTLSNNTRLKVNISSNSLVDRVSDFINSKDKFIEFLTEDGFNIFISKYKISMIKEKTVY